MQRLTNNGLLARVRADAAGFRTLAVSYCSHDVYGGMQNTGPEQPEQDRATATRASPTG